MRSILGGVSSELQDFETELLSFHLLFRKGVVARMVDPRFGEFVFFLVAQPSVLWSSIRRSRITVGKQLQRRPDGIRCERVAGY